MSLNALAPKTYEVVTASSRPPYVWLLGDGPVRPADSLTLEEFESAAEFAMDCWQVLPALAPRLLAWSQGRFEDSPYASKIRDLSIGIQALARVQTTLLQRFTSEMDRQRIPYVLLKGSASRLTCYPEPTMRGGLDVDIGVPHGFLDRAEAIVLEQGFLYSSLDETKRHFFQITEEERADVEANHYELACLVRKQVIRDLDPEEDGAIRRSISFLRPWHVNPNGDLGCYVTFDIHHGLCLDIEVDSVVTTSERTQIAGYSARTPRADWAVFHLIFKIYWEGVHNYRKGGYQYADLIRLIPRVRGALAMGLISLLSHYYLEAAAYYVLRRLQTEFHLKLSPELEAFVDLAGDPPEDEFPNDINDLGDMWPKIWGYR